MIKSDKSYKQVEQKLWPSRAKIVTELDKNCDQVGQKFDQVGQKLLPTAPKIVTKLDKKCDQMGKKL